MTSNQTINIPADLGGGWSPKNLRNAAASLDHATTGPLCGIDLMLNRLAKYMEAQTRPVGWYRVTVNFDYKVKKRVLWWTGSHWTHSCDDTGYSQYLNSIVDGSTAVRFDSTGAE